MAAKIRRGKKSSGAISFVIMIGDEGAILVQMQGNTVMHRLFASSPEPANVRGFDETLSDSPNAPITILFDMMDQSYVRQTLPPVSSFSVGKIIKRRLNKDFAPDDIKGYVLLDREKTGRKDWNYLMVSLANNTIIQKWLDFLMERSNPFRGMGLVPLETQSFIIAIEKAFAKAAGTAKGVKPLEWQILVSHNKVGGFRQVVLRDNKLVFTRMAQPFGESLADVIAGNIEQEMINTLEYLKRLGLQDPSTISMTIITSEDIKKALDPKNIKAGQYHFLTPFELANLLSLHDGAQVSDQFGDVVISAFVGKQRKLLLPLNTPYTRKIRDLSLYIKAVKTLGVLTILGIIAWTGSNIWDITDADNEIDNIETHKKTLQSDLEIIKAKTATLPKDINLFTDVMTMSQLFDKRPYDVLALLSNFAPSLQNTALVSDFHWVLKDPLAVTKTTDNRQMEMEVDLHLTIPHDPHSKYVSGAQDLLQRIKKTFAGFTVSYPDVPGMISDNQEIKTILSDSGTTVKVASSENQSDNVKVTITGPISGKTVNRPIR